MPFRNGPQWPIITKLLPITVWPGSLASCVTDFTWYRCLFFRFLSFVFWFVCLLVGSLAGLSLPGLINGIYILVNLRNSNDLGRLLLRGKHSQILDELLKPPSRWSKHLTNDIFVANRTIHPSTYLSVCIYLLSCLLSAALESYC